jgi:hypothetical protein
MAGRCMRVGDLQLPLTGQRDCADRFLNSYFFQRSGHNKNYRRQDFEHEDFNCEEAR